MEFVACLIGGLLLSACGVGLFAMRPPDWTVEGPLVSQEQQAIEWWFVVQRYVRWVTNCLLILIGGVISVTAFVPHGRTWMMMWAGILVLLLLCILFAMVDALGSVAGYRRAVPGAARRSFGTADLVEGGSPESIDDGPSAIDGESRM